MYYFESKEKKTRYLYEGWFVNGRLHGYGSWVRQDKQRYTGDFVDGLKTGYGKYSWPSGAWQEGSWIDGLMNGKGEYHYADGDKYVGEWLDDQKHGEGEFLYADSSKLQGSWVKNSMEGEFKYYSKSDAAEPEIRVYKGNKRVTEKSKEVQEEVKLQAVDAEEMEGEEFFLKRIDITPPSSPRLVPTSSEPSIAQ